METNVASSAPSFSVSLIVAKASDTSGEGLLLEDGVWPDALLAASAAARAACCRLGAARSPRWPVMEVSRKVPVSGSSGCSAGPRAGVGGSSGASSEAGAEISSGSAVLVQPLHSTMAPAAIGDRGSSTTASFVWFSAAPLRPLAAEEALVEALLLSLGAEELLFMRPFSLSFCRVAIFCWRRSSSCRWMRSFAASNSTFAAFTRALPAASLFASRPSRRAICRRPRWSSVSSPPLAFSSLSWSCLCGSCSTALSSRKYFSRKLGSLKPTLAPPPLPEASPGAGSARRWEPAIWALRSTTSSKSAGIDTSGSSEAASAPGSAGGGRKVRACSSSKY
mmetsp:Transcript_26148/g.78165  ORF Transcript_26148/g.78165 Transcript_26148/m.78165 type:complete len:336 (+) Transcript_26148:1382-2389(+)